MAIKHIKRIVGTQYNLMYGAVGVRLKPRQFGISSDTAKLIYMDASGVPHICHEGDIIDSLTTDGTVSELQIKAGSQSNYLFSNNQNSTGYGGAGAMGYYAGQNGHYFYIGSTTNLLKIASTGITIPAFTTAGIVINSSAGLLSSNDSIVPRKMFLSQAVYNDLYISTIAAKVPAANYPAWTAYSSNLLNGYTFNVDDYLDLTSPEVLHNWKEGTNLDVHLHLVTNALTSEEIKQRYRIYYSWGDVNEVMSAIDSLTAEVTIPNATAANTHLFLDMGDLTGTNYLVGSIIKIRVKRVAKSAGGIEGSATSVFMEMIGIHYQINKLGSRLETSN